MFLRCLHSALSYSGRVFLIIGAVHTYRLVANTTCRLMNNLYHAIFHRLGPPLFSAILPPIKQLPCCLDGWIKQSLFFYCKSVIFCYYTWSTVTAGCGHNIKACHSFKGKHHSTSEAVRPPNPVPAPLVCSGILCALQIFITAASSSAVRGFITNIGRKEDFCFVRA